MQLFPFLEFFRQAPTNWLSSSLCVTYLVTYFITLMDAIHVLLAHKYILFRLIRLSRIQANFLREAETTEDSSHAMQWYQQNKIKIYRSSTRNRESDVYVCISMHAYVCMYKYVNWIIDASISYSKVSKVSLGWMWDIIAVGKNDVVWR